jgi:UDP-N-acetylmuramoyl-tripeptide--D-alanyl-D-alanine ligase
MTALAEGRAPGLLYAGRSVLKQAAQTVKRVRHGLKALEARFKRSRSHATFIAVTGSSGKTTTVSLLTHILSADCKVRTQVVRNGFDNAVTTLRRLTKEDQFIVLEMGTSGPGRLEKVARLVKPDISIVTLVALEHFPAFQSLEEVAQEKATIVRTLPETGLAILNADDANVRAMSGSTSARVTLFGSADGGCQVASVRTSAEGTLALTIRHGNRSIDLDTQLIGAHNWLAVSAAVTCALEVGVPPQTIAARVASFAPVLTRLSVHKIADGPTFILDGKAPLHSILLPLEVLRTITAPRKRFVLGNISDYRGNPVSKYRDAYRAARNVADEVIVVGTAARKVRPLPEDLQSGRFRAFESVQAAAAYLKQTAEAGEVILVKSAGSLHLERLMLDRADGVRCWANECGNKASCFDCGLYRAPFFEHSGKSKRKRRRLPSLWGSKPSVPASYPTETYPSPGLT